MGTMIARQSPGCSRFCSRSTIASARTVFLAPDDLDDAAPAGVEPSRALPTHLGTTATRFAARRERSLVTRRPAST